MIPVDSDFNSVMNCMNPMERLRTKGMLDIEGEVTRVRNIPNKVIQQEINAALQLALQNKRVLAGLPPSAAEAKRTYIQQLNELLNRFKRTTNYIDGKKAFEEDVQQILLWQQEVFKAWPLDTMHWTCKKFKPNECEQQRYNY